MKKKTKKTNAKNLEKRFESGKNVLDYFDASKAVRGDIASHPQRVNVDFQPWVVEKLDQEASRIGTTRQSLIKMWIVQRLDSLIKKTA